MSLGLSAAEMVMGWNTALREMDPGFDPTQPDEGLAGTGLLVPDRHASPETVYTRMAAAMMAVLIANNRRIEEQLLAATAEDR